MVNFIEEVVHEFDFSPAIRAHHAEVSYNGAIRML
jgi:hypothetical protein